MIFDKLFNKDKDSGKSTETKPVSAVDYYAEGKAQFDAGHYTQAMEYFQAAMAEHPERENAYLKLADTFLTMGKQKEASSTLHKLLTINPTSIAAQEKLVMCQQILPQKPSIQSSTKVNEQTAPTIATNLSNSHEIHISGNSHLKSIKMKGVHFNMIKVTGGIFEMGASREMRQDCWNDEKPAHTVSLNDFYIAETQVTQALWELVMQSNPSNWIGKDLPVERVSYVDARDFVNRLNELTKQNFRLPTEAEWEYAARGGEKNRGFRYSGSDNIDEVAWYWRNSGDEYLEYTDNDREGISSIPLIKGLFLKKNKHTYIQERINSNNCRTHPVKQKSPNELGIYDMSGNVWEWCMDRFGKYQSESQNNPKGIKHGSYRVCRGGGWFSNANRCRVSNRLHRSSTYRGNYIGVRLAMDW